MPRLHHTDSKRAQSLVPGNTILVGRSQDADLPVPDLSCSRQQFRIQTRQDGTCSLQPLSRTSPTFCEGTIVHDERELDRNVQITAGQSTFLFVLDDSDETLLPAGPQLTDVHAPTADVPVETLGPIAVGEDSIIGRDPHRASIFLPHVQVSRTHARLSSHETGTLLTDLASSGGTYVNGQRLRSPRQLRTGDRIGIGPYQFTFQEGVLTGATREDGLTLVAHGLTRIVPDRLSGKTILDDVSLRLGPHEFVCLLGPAGSGKSTLLSALSARRPADHGRVMLNHLDLYRQFEQLKHDLVVVPQQDPLHTQLTVEQALRYTAQLRLPQDTSSDEVQAVVQQTLDTVGLLSECRTRIGNLSGGQTKRTSLALEILANPSLIFLDEVTSGLDEESDRELMTLFRRLADDGKTLVCITHNLTNVERTCHRVLILAPGCFIQDWL